MNIETKGTTMAQNDNESSNPDRQMHPEYY